jgi:D-3-phosphoglycerate dehydrogenase
MPKVLIADKMAPEAAAIFKERGLDVDIKVGLSPAELKEIINNYDGLAVRSACKVTAEVFNHATRLKVVGRAGIGVDTIDCDAATQNGIVVMNTPFGNATTTAEHAIAMLMSCARRIPQANASTHAGKWEKNKFTGVEITGKTLGLIGCGNIGSIVAERALGLKMKVIAFDPFLSEERAQNINVTKVTLDDVFKKSDFITIHTPLIEQTRNIVSAGKIALMKPTAYLINCARGGLIDEVALKDALDNKKIAGVALDVFEIEPAHDHPLFGYENVICTPHLGASTIEAQEIVSLQIAEQISDFLLTGAVTNALNMPSVSETDAKKLKPYLELANKLGSFIGQIAVTDNSLKTIKITYDGTLSQLNTKPLTASITASILKSFSDNVNMVNGPVLLKEKGIKLSETTQERSTIYDGFIQVDIETDKQKRMITGTVFLDNKSRIICLDNIRMEAEFSNFMLYTQNTDTPGHIGALGTLLGEAQLNIADFRLGRLSQGGKAVALVQIDSLVDNKTLDKIKNLPQVIDVVQIKIV